MNRLKKIFILLLLLSLPLSAATRDLEVEYPVVPGIDPPGPDTGLPAYIEYLYYLIIGLAGIAVLVSFIWGGLIYLTSSGAPGKMQQGRRKIFAALGGVAIIFLAHLVLTNIDPQFLGGALPAVKLPTRGYCLRGHELGWQEGDECSKGWKAVEKGSCQKIIGEYEGPALQTTCCQVEPRTYCFEHSRENILPAGFVAKEISFREKIPNIMEAYFFPQPIYQGRQKNVYSRNYTDEDVAKEIWHSIDMTERPVSVYIVEWFSGFYLYPDRAYGCRYEFAEYPRHMPLLLASSHAELGEHDDRVAYIKRETMGEGDNWMTTIPWVGIFFSLINYRGGCGIIYGFRQAPSPSPNGHIPVPNGGDVEPTCFSVRDIDSGGIQGGIDFNENKISSAHVFRRLPNTAKVEGHVIFYEAANYIVPQAGVDLIAKKIEAKDIQAKNEQGKIWTINLNYDQGVRNDRNEWGQERILSVEMTKNFIVVLNSEKDFKGKCTLLTENHPNLQHLYVLQDEQAGAKGARVKSIAIIPIQ